MSTGKTYTNTILIKPHWDEVWRHIAIYEKEKGPIWFGYSSKKKKHVMDKNKVDELKCSMNKSKPKLIMASKSEIQTGYDVVVWNFEDVDQKSKKFRPPLYNLSDRKLKKRFGGYGKYKLWFKISNPKTVKNVEIFLPSLKYSEQKRIKSLVFDKKENIFGNSRSALLYVKYPDNKSQFCGFGLKKRLIRNIGIKPIPKTKLLLKKISRIIKKFNEVFEENPKGFLNEYEVQCGLYKMLIEGFQSEINENAIVIYKESPGEKLKRGKKQRIMTDIEICDGDDNSVCLIEIKYAYPGQKLENIKRLLNEDIKKIKGWTGFVLFYSNTLNLAPDETKKLNDLSKEKIRVVTSVCSLEKIIEVYSKYFQKD